MWTHQYKKCFNSAVTYSENPTEICFNEVMQENNLLRSQGNNIASFCFDYWLLVQIKISHITNKIIHLN